MRRSSLTLLLLAVLSGVPRMVGNALGLEDPCPEECEGSLGSQSCPPNCTQGVCAKTVVGLASSASIELVRPSTRDSVRLASETVRLPEVATRVFHPPRA